MSWIRGSASNYQTLSDALEAAATGDSVATAVIATAGTGYTVGDILDVVGGTGTVTAQVEVTAISGGGGTGPITAVRRYNDGVYTATPSTPNSVTNGTGALATVTLTFTGGNGWTTQRNEGESLTSVDLVADGGTGYAEDDIITLSGGAFDTVATLRVTGETGGVIDTVSIEDAGVYNAAPADPVAQASVAPTGGLGAEFNLTWNTGQKQVIMKGSGGGADNIYVGWRSFSEGVDHYNWELHGFTGFTSTVGMDNQPGVSPGLHDGASGQQAGAYLLLHNTSIEYWFTITPYRITIVVKVGSKYFNAYLGWGNRFATITEYPYPAVVAGHTSDALAKSIDNKLSSGLVDPWRSSGTEPAVAGPMFVRFTDGAWHSVWNAEVSVSSRSTRRDRCVMPCQIPQGQQDASGGDVFTSSQASFNDILPVTGLSPTFVATLHPTPGTVDYRILFPATVVFTEPTEQVVLELDDIYWISGSDGLLSEDRIIQDGEVYRVFQNCNRGDNASFLAIKEV